MKKNYKTSKHTNKLYILHQTAKKTVNILKIGYNKKWIVLVTWCSESLKKLTRTGMLTD